MPKKQSKNDLEQQVGELTEDLQRLQADFINFRRRAEEDQMSSLSAGKALVINELLPVLDNVGRALTNVPDDLKKNEFVLGVVSVGKQLDDALAKLGVTKIETVGQEFDPEKMEAVLMEEGDGEKEIVSEELQSGFELNGEVIRHAMVKVKK